LFAIVAKMERAQKMIPSCCATVRAAWPIIRTAKCSTTFRRETGIAVRSVPEGKCLPTPSQQPSRQKDEKDCQRGKILIKKMR